ncbi:MAG TPA: DUF4236 domain-containing protein [Verrucomicrobiae bacterium]|jgi:uncharacterized protein YegL|nr:DUF4236 domain-containing protein [Verrucomicrobiae bacterium]
MSWRWRKVFNRGPLRTTVTTKGIGWSIGIPGLRYEISSSGRHYVSAGIPGIGLYWIKYLDGRDTTQYWRRIDMEQTPFDAGKIGFADNPEPRCASLLVLDISSSMGGAPISELQSGIAVYRDELAADTLARKRVEIGIVTFGGSVDVVQNFTTAESFTPPALAPKGDTPMGEAVVTALKLLEDRKAEYRQNGIQFYRPWVFLITDGGPTDAGSQFWTEAKEKLHQGEEQKKFSFFAVGVEGADMDRLTELSPQRAPLKLKGLRFRDLFQWLSNSQQSVSQSKPGDAVPLSNPATPTGWAQV